MMFRAAENEEDISERGKRDVENNGISDKDVLVGISASGNAAYVVEALKEAKRRKAVTIGLTCNNDALIREVSDCTIVTDTGSEVISGSTRLNAGTAHKIVLNILSTCSMVKQGYVYENMMINLKGTNEKLKKRQIFIVSELCDITLGEAEKLLNSADGNIKAAVEAHKSRTC